MTEPARAAWSSGRPKLGLRLAAGSRFVALCEDEKTPRKITSTATRPTTDTNSVLVRSRLRAVRSLTSGLVFVRVRGAPPLSVPGAIEGVAENRRNALRPSFFRGSASDTRSRSVLPDSRALLGVWFPSHCPDGFPWDPPSLLKSKLLMPKPMGASAGRSTAPLSATCRNSVSFDCL